LTQIKNIFPLALAVNDALANSAGFPFDLLQQPLRFVIVVHFER